MGPILVSRLLSKNRPWQNYFYLPLSIAVTSLIGILTSTTGTKVGVHALEPRTPGRFIALSTEVHSPLWRRLKSIFKRSSVLVGLALLVIGSSMGSIYSGWSATFIQQNRSGSDAEGGTNLAIFWASITISRVSVGSYLQVTKKANLILCLSLLCAMASALTFHLIDNLKVFMACAAIFGFAIGPIVPFGIRTASDKLPEDAVTLMTCVSLIFTLLTADCKN